MKTVAIIASCDTKYKEVAYMRQCLNDYGLKVIVIDSATGDGPSYGADISRTDVLRKAGIEWYSLRTFNKSEKINAMTNAMKITLLKLWNESAFDGVLSAGGLQATVVATSAMQLLPIGIPKVMATTVACGKRQFAIVSGKKDIMIIPSIADFTGLNAVTRTILQNACASMAGLCMYGSGILRKPEKPLVALTLMGVTNNGANGAIQEFEENSFEVVGFHSTGVGGEIMEDLAAEGFFKGILDLTTHEIASEYIGYGFSFGTNKRLYRLAELDIPYVACTGGLDFVDVAESDRLPMFNERKKYWHNASIAHVKLLEEEAIGVAKIFTERLNESTREISVLLPDLGMRHNTLPGEDLFDPTVDEALYTTIKDMLLSKHVIKQISGNLDTISWGRLAARELIRKILERGEV